MASFTKEVNPSLASRPLKINGRLANCELTSLVKEATGMWTVSTVWLYIPNLGWKDNRELKNQQLSANPWIVLFHTVYHPRARGGAANHGSWRKTVVNFHSNHDHLGRSNQTMHLWSRIIPVLNYWIGITSFKSTPTSSESTSLSTSDDVIMVDECKHNTPTHVKKNF